MEKKGWKITAITFIVLFTLLVSWIVLGLIIIEKEANEQRHCFYDICEEYPDADYFDKVCTCYDYDNLGYLVVTKTEVID